jgi:tetratricopeptide (TPR) repeat protein
LVKGKYRPNAGILRDTITMRFAFIPDGTQWQKFVSTLFVADRDRKNSPVEGFQSVSSERLRDFGLDGYSTCQSGTVYQMYYPLWEPKEPRHKRVIKKLHDTLLALECNQREIERVIGKRAKRLVIIVPEDPDVKIRQSQSKVNREASIQVEVWGESEISDLFNRHRRSVKDFLPFDFDKPQRKKRIKKEKEPPQFVRVFQRGIKARNKGKYEEARRLFKNSLEVAKNNRHRLAEGKARHMLGVVLFEKDDRLEDAIVVLQESLRVFEKCGSSHWQASTLFQMGKIETLAGELDKAWAHTSKALEIHKGSKKDQDIAWDLQQLGWIQLHRGKLDEAQQLCEQALSIFQGLYQGTRKEDDIIVADAIGCCYHDQGVLFAKSGRPEQAKGYFLEAIEWQRKAGLKQDIMRSLFSLARIEFQIGEYEDGKGYLDEAIRLAKEAGNAHLEAQYIELEARYFYTIGDKKASIATFEVALSRLRDDDLERTKYLNQIGLFFLEEGNLELAKQRFSHVLSLSLPDILIEERASATSRLARIASLEEKKNEAGEWWKQTIEVLEKLVVSRCPKPQLARTFGWLGAVHEELGNIQDALRYYVRARTEFEELHDVYGLTRAICSVGHMHGRLHNRQEEFKAYHKAKRLISRTGFHDLIAGTAIDLSNIYLDLGNLSEARNMLQEAIHLCGKHRIRQYDKVLNKLVERFNQEAEIRRVPIMDFRDLVGELYALVDWFPEAQDSILRLWIWGRQEQILANFRALDGVKLVIYEDDTDKFLKLAEMLNPFADLCLQVVSTEYPGVGMDLVPYPKDKEFFFDFALPVIEKREDNKVIVRYVQGGIDSRYSLTSDSIVSKATGNEGAVIMGWAIGLPGQAHKLLLSSSRAEILKGKVFFLAYQRHLAENPFLNDLGFSKHFGMIPVYIDHLPRSDDVELIRRRPFRIHIPRKDGILSSSRYFDRIKMALRQLPIARTETIGIELNRLADAIQDLATNSTADGLLELDVYFLKFTGTLEDDTHIAVVVRSGDK